MEEKGLIRHRLAYCGDFGVRGVTKVIIECYQCTISGWLYAEWVMGVVMVMKRSLDRGGGEKLCYAHEILCYALKIKTVIRNHTNRSPWL